MNFIPETVLTAEALNEAFSEKAGADVTSAALAAISEELARKADSSEIAGALAKAEAALPRSGGTMTGGLVLAGDPTDDMHAVPKRYVDQSSGRIVRHEKIEAYTLSASDKGALIDCYGAWPLDLPAADTLGNGLWCYVRNNGSGTITVRPSGGELIGGMPHETLLPGMALLIQCDGTGFHSLRVAAGASVWASGSYVEGVTVYSPSNYQTYRRTASLPGASTVDPALDRTRWAQLSVSPGELLLTAMLLY